MNEPLSSRSDSSKEECKHCDRTIFLPPTFADNPGATHWEECWRAHHACAVATIERLLKAPLSEQRDRNTKNSINADKYAGNGMGAWDNDALWEMASAVCRVFPKVGSMETAHKIVAAVVRAQEQFERN